MAIDSVRIEADAATASIRVAERSRKMVRELGGKDTSELTPEQLARHTRARLDKHKAAVVHCDEMDVTNYSVTDPQVALMKFPHGGAKPGLRLTKALAGAAVRFCVAYLLSSKPTDHDVLGPMLDALRARLTRVGVPDDMVVKVAADAGFCSEEDVLAATANTLIIDVALARPCAGPTRTKGRWSSGSATGARTAPASTVHDLTDWPGDLIDTVVDFVLALQAPNHPEPTFGDLRCRVRA